MVLEDILSRSWELSRYRRPPLGQWLDGFCDWLHERCYSHTTIREHLCEVSHFNEGTVKLTEIRAFLRRNRSNV